MVFPVIHYSRFPTVVMHYYQHRFHRIEEYLHQRSPYLLVQAVLAIDASGIVTQTVISGAEFFMPGHFPGAPIVPGAMLQEMTTQSAGILIAAEYNPMMVYNTADPFANEYALGVLVKIRRARFRGFARPGDTLTINVILEENVSDVFDFSAQVSVDGKAIMRNAFQLANIPSRTLQGR
jgi:3-hydroxyacyl-[acyl-carrier-protein] dehydratase